MECSDLFGAKDHGRSQMEAHVIKLQDADGLSVLISVGQQQEEVMHLSIYRVLPGF